MGSADTPEAGAPQAPRHRALMAVVIGMGVLIVAMVILLFLGVSLGWGKKDKSAAPGTAAPSVPMPAGAAGEAADIVPLEIQTAPESRLYTLAGDGSRIALHIAAPTGDEIIVVDTAANRVISRIRLKPEGGVSPP